MRGRLGRSGFVLCSASIAALLPSPARAFAVLVAPRFATVEQVLSETPRWTEDERIGRNLRDGIEVRVHPNFEEDLGATNADEVELVRTAVRTAFAAWENDALRFEIEFDASGTVPGPGLGGEIDVFTRFGDEPPFLHSPTIFGFGSISSEFLEDRLLTNGQRLDGQVITGGEVELNATLLRQTQQDFGIGIEFASFALVRLLMHEIGHTIGFDHPNERRNFDTDLDPETEAAIDPLDPFAGIINSTNFLQGAVMSNQPCGGPLGQTGICSALFLQALTPDDRLGRDVLYPVPEPGEEALIGVALLVLAGLRCWRVLPGELAGSTATRRAPQAHARISTAKLRRHGLEGAWSRVSKPAWLRSTAPEPLGHRYFSSSRP